MRRKQFFFWCTKCGRRREQPKHESIRPGVCADCHRKESEYPAKLGPAVEQVIASYDS